MSVYLVLFSYICIFTALFNSGNFCVFFLTAFQPFLMELRVFFIDHDGVKFGQIENKGLVVYKGKFVSGCRGGKGYIAAFGEKVWIHCFLDLFWSHLPDSSPLWIVLRVGENESNQTSLGRNQGLKVSPWPWR